MAWQSLIGNGGFAKSGHVVTRSTGIEGSDYSRVNRVLSPLVRPLSWVHARFTFREHSYSTRATSTRFPDASQMTSQPLGPGSFRVLSLSSSARIGGGNRSLLLLQQGMSKRGIRCEIVVPGEGEMTTACVESGIPHSVVPAIQPDRRRPLATVRAYRAWSRVMKRFRPSVIHANDPYTTRSIAAAAKRHRVPVVCHVRFPVDAETTMWLFRRIPTPDAFIFNSNSLHSECGEYFARACPTSHHFVVHNAVDTKLFRPSSQRHERLRIGIIANLIPIKGHTDFLEMAAHLREEAIDAEYWIVGDDIHQTGYGQKLRRRVAELGLACAVKFLGHQSDIPDILNQLSIVVCASHVEPFGRCVAEAMACGCPVVATRVGGIPEVVEDGHSGLLVPPHSPRELANAVASLVRDPDLAHRLAQAGRSRICNQFSVDTHIDAIVRVYNTVSGPRQFRRTRSFLPC